MLSFIMQAYTPLLLYFKVCACFLTLQVINVTTDKKIVFTPVEDRTIYMACGWYYSEFQSQGLENIW